MCYLFIELMTSSNGTLVGIPKHLSVNNHLTLHFLETTAVNTFLNTLKKKKATRIVQNTAKDTFPR